MNITLTAERARELFSYDRDTGVLHWRISPCNAVKAGREAGANTPAYRETMADGEMYVSHRIIWLMAYGHWPKGEVDHIDGDGFNNRLSNLRDVSHSINVKNARRRADNTSGVTGVSKSGLWKSYVARVRVDGVLHYLGSFPTVEAAAQVREQFMVENPALGFSARHGRAK